MIILGNHLKATSHSSQREKVRSFYKDILQCEMLTSPRPDFDIFQFQNNTFYGVFYTEDCLTDKDHVKATWLEIKTKDVQKLKNEVIKFGVTEIDYADKANFYFQAPGGQVFRIVSDTE